MASTLIFEVRTRRAGGVSLPVIPFCRLAHWFVGGSIQVYHREAHASRSPRSCDITRKIKVDATLELFAPWPAVLLAIGDIEKAAKQLRVETQVGGAVKKRMGTHGLAVEKQFDA